MMRKGVVDVTEYLRHPDELMLGQVAILGGTAAWLAITTALQMPVSTTHALMGSTLGFSLVLRGTEGVNWDEILKISHNVIAPVATLVSIYKDKSAKQEAEVAIYVLLYGVVAICFGLWTLGYRIISTVGSRVSHINPASGFTIEFGAAMTTLIASKFGLLISTTQCLVGSVVFVGSVRSGEGVNWTVFRNIVITWISTLPASSQY
uniref:Phosphate transporter family protein n=1 Tax=Angiostrongylus cantonensis TaxID=6313 RepID=A0A0K0DDL9_ANGCA